MRIGFDAKRIFKNFTGLGNYSRDTVKAISNYFPDNEYFLFTPIKSKSNRLNDLLSQKNIRVHSLDSVFAFAYKKIWSSIFLSTILDEQKIDIYHGLTNELPLGIQNCKAKSFVTIHDLLFLRFSEYYRMHDAKIYNLKFKYACKNSDKIIAISNQTKSDIIHYYGVKEEKIEVIYQGCHSNFRKKYSESEKQFVIDKYNLPKEFLISVGTIEQRKNTLNLLKAINIKKKVLDVPVYVVGKPTDYMKELNEYISNHKLKNIHFIHQAEFTELPILYQLASASVYPSKFEGFGIPIIESLSCGTAVVTSKGSCFSEAGGNCCLYADPDNAEELAEHIYDILTDNVLKNSLLRNSSKHLEQFNDKLIAEKLMSEYHKLL